jgi:flagellar motor switch protein FliN/FliY
MAVQTVELEDFPTNTGLGKHILDNNIDLIKNVKVKLQAYVGDSDITVGELFALKEDSVVTLNQDVEAPINIELDGRVIARGTLVVVDNNFGVRITELAK